MNNIPVCDNQGLIAFEDAIIALKQSAQAITETESCHIEQVLGRVLAQDIFAPLDLPPFDVSAMDGFAVNSTQISMGERVNISQRIAAGHKPTLPLEANTAARIFTGASLPEGADSVILQEQCEYDQSSVQLPNKISPGQNVRQKGCHLAQAQLALSAGTRLSSAHIGLLASMGISHIDVFRRLKVSLLTTGNELVEPGRALVSGQIYNANRYLLQSMLTSLGCEVNAIDVVEDELNKVRGVLQSSAARSDLVMSSGGVSVGDEDHVRSALESLGQLSFWRIRIKPGKPLAYGKINNTAFIGLPGNPVSSFVTFCLFARPLICALQGRLNDDVLGYPVIAGFERTKKDKRREFMRVSIYNNEHGQMIAKPYASQDSATLMSASHTHGLLCVPENTFISSKTLLQFYPYNELLG